MGKEEEVVQVIVQGVVKGFPVCFESKPVGLVNLLFTHLSVETLCARTIRINPGRGAVLYR